MNNKRTTGYARFLLLTVFCLAASVGSAFAQLTMTETHLQVTQLSIGDLDFKTFGSTHWFFTLNIMNNSGVPVNALLDMSIDVLLADNTSYPNAAELITQAFPVPASGMTISNTDLGPTSSIKSASFNYNANAESNIKNLALSTGKMPAGTYTFHVKLELAPSGNQVSESDIVLTLINSSRVDLILPPNQSTIANAFPLFQWIYDGSNVELSVYEKLPNDQSDEDAANGVPFLDITSGTPGFPSGSNSYQYPTSGPRPLQTGHTYVWKIAGLTTGSGGSGPTINSELWEFTVQAGVAGSDTSGTSQILTTQLLNLGFSQDVVNQILSGTLSPTGVIMLNGQAISAADVAAILSMLAANPDKIISVNIVQ
jgi:hypothetical protein